MTPDQLYAMQQAYQRMDIKGNAERAKQRGDNGDMGEINVSGLMNAPSQTAKSLNGIASETKAQNYQNMLNQRQAYQNQILERQIKGLGNSDAIAGSQTVGNNVQSGGNKANIVPGSLATATQNLDNKQLKYSQKRGKGCTDCSAAMQTIYKDSFGKDIGGWTGVQKNAGVSVKPSNRQYGDLVTFNTKDGRGLDVSHIGYDNGNGRDFTHFSSSNGGGIRITPYKGYYPVVDTRRVI